MMTKDQCAAVIEQFSSRIQLDQYELTKLKATYQSMFGVDYDEEIHIHRFAWEPEAVAPDVSAGQCVQCGLTDCAHMAKATVAHE